MGKSRVFFPAPIIGEVAAPRPPGRPTILAYHEIQNLTKALRDDGWDVRSVVSKLIKFNSGTLNYYEMARPLSWGVIVDVRNTVGITGTVYFPFKVQWVADGSISEHWPEELVLIHDAVSQHTVENIIRGRGDE